MLWGVKEKTLTATAYKYIYDSVVNGVISTNDIITEASLTKQLEMSKTPIREALVALCTEGILRSIPRLGYHVVQILPHDVQGMFETRFTLESALLIKTVAKISNAQIKQLKEYNEFAREDFLIHNTAQECWARNTQFHLLLASFGDNEYMLRLLEQTLKSCERATTQYFLRKAQGLFDDPQPEYHEELVEYIKSKDLDSALTLLKKDVYLILSGTVFQV